MQPSIGVFLLVRSVVQATIARDMAVKQLAYVALCLVVIFLGLAGWQMMIFAVDPPQWSSWALRELGFVIVTLGVLRISKGMPK